MFTENTFQMAPAKQDTGFKILDIGFIFLYFIVFIAMAFFNAASSIPVKGLFKNTAGNISASIEVDITPAGWTFSTWGIIYTWTGLWLILNIAYIFIRSNSGRMYKQPPVFTKRFQIFMLANFLLNITWLFLWDNKLLSV